MKGQAMNGCRDYGNAPMGCTDADTDGGVSDDRCSECGATDYYLDDIGVPLIWCRRCEKPCCTHCLKNGLCPDCQEE